MRMVSLSTVSSIDEKLPAERAISQAAEAFEGKLVMSTSFGIQSSVLLHMVTRQVPDIPVIWIDTGYLPAETYRYADTLTERLGLNVHLYQGRISPAYMEARYGKLWDTGVPEDLDRYHWIRKLEPMKRALNELGASAWLAGIRKSQTSHRRELSRVTMQWGVVKIHPILNWGDRDVDRYIERYDLPRHPLAEQGFSSVGDAHLSAPQAANIGNAPAGARSGRFNGLREECGLHVQYEPRVRIGRLEQL